MGRNDQEGNALQVLHKKLKATIKALSAWSRIAYGDFHEEPKKLENTIKDLEENSINNNTPENRINISKAKVEFTRFLKIQEKVLSQKARIKWLEDGDTNSAFFHRVIKDKRKKHSIHKIKDQEGNWVEGTTQVVDVAVNFFTNLFKAEPTEEDSNIFNLVERVVTIEDNNNLNSLSTLQEIKNTIFSIDPDSAPGPDELNGKFYQSTWQIIAADLHAAIISFFQGAILSFSHTCIVMLPKVNSPQDFSEIRPISLCNTSCKIIAKLINKRVSKILHNIISPNQSGFVKGRAITENILLAQEIVNDIGKSNFWGNVVIKLDMSKAYDRVSWSFLCFILRRFGFAKSWIDLSNMFISYNWYFVLVNGSRQGFFKSGRGLRQGDPLFPSLFVLSTELLFKMLNSLYRVSAFRGFPMHPYGPQINHLFFVDDTIVFSSGRKATLQAILKTLESYERVSGQSINKNKCSYTMAHTTPLISIKRVGKNFRMRYEHLSIKYLGCPIYDGRKLFEIFTDLICKITNRIKGQPPKGTLEVIERYLTRFYWPGMNLGLQSSEHLFCKGDYAQRIWSSIIGRMGIITRHTNLRELLRRCWNSTSKNPVAEYDLSIILPIIIWELWRLRCNSRYEEKRPSTKISISLIVFNIFHLTKKVFSNINLPENWESLLKLMEIQLEDTIHTTVKWSRPSHHSMKLNMDGSCIGESSGRGGVVRDSNGNCIMAFILPLGNGTSNTAEAKAFLFGLKWCIANGHIFTTVETDSLLLLNSILNLWSTPWRMRKTVEEIRELILRHNIQINHCYREANRVADKLVSYSHLTNTTIVITDTSSLPAHVKGLLNLDKWQFPSFRIKKRKPSLIYYDPP
ncbi:hypothetical protein MTR67_032514 [Solanum verrucosum]|uniref:Reverse transcriptase domain-containing protein n=1 Tax=Solanum verrucosum TaxID=315347 RepID=A0AAF0U4L0_SOLVR|nr:hypothetical protein MTR67_032514 [Solanum verrucosum]